VPHFRKLTTFFAIKALSFPPFTTRQFAANNCVNRRIFAENKAYEKGILQQEQAGGRSTNYELNEF
jgi:hypothetical protein